MSNALLSPVAAHPVSRALGLGELSGTQLRPTQRSAAYSNSSTLAELPGYSAVMSVETTGEQLGNIFTQNPDLPGAILFAQTKFVGVISQAHFYKCVSRAFGREIYNGRPVAIMLNEIAEPPLVLFSVCGIQSAVDQCLQRPAELVYEPFLVHDEQAGEYRLCAFQELLLASSELAALRNRQMGQILGTVTDGLLVIDRSLRIGPEYSRAVDHLFETTSLGQRFLPDVLAPLIDATAQEQLLDYLRILFDPKLIDRLIRTINPAKQLTLHFGTGASRRTKHLAINFERIRVSGTTGEISQILVRLEDVTQQVNLARELKQQEAVAEEKLHLVMQMLQIEPALLERFNARFEQDLAAMERLLARPEEGGMPKEVVQQLFRRAHTLKGEASLLRLSAHERLLHQFEDDLDKLRDLPALTVGHLSTLQPRLEALLRLAEQIDQAFDQLKFINRASPTVAPAASPALPPVEEESFIVTKPTPVAGAPARPIPATARGLVPVSTFGLIETMNRLVADLSQRLGKPATFHSGCKESEFPSAYLPLLQEALLHLARNSMVHGFEPVPERIACGKNASGLIQVELREHDDVYEIVYQDDGGGLPLEKIRQKAQRRGLPASSEAELLNLIFQPGFSTAEQVNDLAGRGVGLDVIHHLVIEAGGRIVPHTEAGAWCAFQIVLPKKGPSA